MSSPSDGKPSNNTTAPINANNQPSLIHIAEILQHSIELKLCSSVATHNVFWDTLFHGVENNQDAMAMVISLLLTKYIQLNAYEKSSHSLIQALFAKISNQREVLSHEEIINVLSGKSLSRESTAGEGPEDDDADDGALGLGVSTSAASNRDSTNSNGGNVQGVSSTPGTPTSAPGRANVLMNLDPLLLDDLRELTGQNKQSGGTQGESNVEGTAQGVSAQAVPATPDVDVNSDEYRENELSKTSILATVTFLSLNYGFNSQHPTLRVMLNKFNEVIDRTKADYMIQTEISRILSPGFKESNEYIFFLLDQSADLAQVSEGAKQLRNSWFNSFVREMLRSSGSRSKAVFDNLFLFLKHPLLTEKKTLIFMQMLKHYLLVSPIVAPPTIAAALSIVKTYYLWPKPYCVFAQELLEILSIEEKCPGHYYRATLALELPALSLYTNTSSTVNNLAVQRTRPVVHMLIDRYNSEALVVQELFEINAKLGSVSAMQYQANNLANIYERVLGVDNSVLGLEYLDPSDLTQFHFKVLDVMNKTIYFEESESKSIRIRELAALREEMVRVATGYKEPGVKGCVPQTISLPNLSYQFHSMNRISIRNKKPDEFGSPYQIPLFKKSVASLSNIFASYQEQDVHSVCSLAIVGNDASIQHVLNGYVFLQYQSPYLFEDIDVQFYIIPAGPQCKFFESLAAFDPWYHRQALLGYKSLFNIIPTFSPDNFAQSSNLAPDQGFLESISQIQLGGGEAKAEEAQHTMLMKPPSYVIQSEMEYLFREASFKLDLPIMKCECWNEDLYYSVTFLMKAELNLNSYLATQTEGLNLDAGQINKLSSKFSAYNINAKFLQINQSELSCIESKSFTEIVIQNNLPKSINTQISANNNRSNLTTSLDLSHSSQQQQNSPQSLGSVTDPLYKPKMDLSFAEEKKKKIERYNFDIESVEIELSDKKKFDVLLDSQLHGPLNKIKISFCTLKPTLDKNKLEHHYITFPVMTFLPNY